MKIQERHIEIIKYLEENGKASVDELVKKFNTTGTTIRNDLITLAKENKIIRTYGGAILGKEAIGDQPVNYKAKINIDKKKIIAKEAVKLINDGDLLLFDAGSTVVQMTSLLQNFHSLTIMTNSLTIINELASFDNDHTIILSGGTYRKTSASFHHNMQKTEEDFKQYQFDYLFIGADAIDEQGRITTFNDSYHGSIAMMKASKKIVLLVDSSKFGRRASNLLFTTNDVDIIITDAGLPDNYYNSLKQQSNLNIIIAE